jgi:hypothetical protein
MPPVYTVRGQGSGGRGKGYGKVQGRFERKIKRKRKTTDFAVAKSVSRLRRLKLARLEQARKLKWSLYRS